MLVALGGSATTDGGTGMLLACGATLVPGFSELAQLTGLETAVAGADLVITGGALSTGRPRWARHRPGWPAWPTTPAPSWSVSAAASSGPLRTRSTPSSPSTADHARWPKALDPELTSAEFRATAVRARPSRNTSSPARPQVGVILTTTPTILNLVLGDWPVGANAFTTGTVDLTAAPATAVVALPNMAPGDTVTAPLTVSNAGTLAYRYSMLSTVTASTPDLAAQLDFTVKTGVTTCTTAGFTATGTAVYGAADLGSTAGLKVLGDAAQGAQAGDRTLAAGANEVLCLQVSLPNATDNTYQGKSTTATLKFDAEQTANN